MRDLESAEREHPSGAFSKLPEITKAQRFYF